MKAYPIIPGRSYRVHYGETVVYVLAPSPVDALIIVAKAKEKYDGKSIDQLSQKCGN